MRWWSVQIHTVLLLSLSSSGFADTSPCGGGVVAGEEVVSLYKQRCTLLMPVKFLGVEGGLRTKRFRNKESMH